MFNTQKLKQVLEGIPKELHDIFITPSTNEIKLVEAYMHLRQREVIRNKVMEAQRKHGLPLEPNTSMARVVMKIRLKEKNIELHKPPRGYQEDGEI